MEHILGNAASAPIDVDMNNFMAEVVEGSSKLPVVVQFWAPWCGPCKQLGPTLEKVVAAANGKVKMLLAKLKEIRGGGWSDNLDAAVKSYNEQLNRTGGMAPTEAVALDKEAQKEYRDRIIANNNARSIDFMVRRPLEEGTRVRLKLAKSKLDKASVPSWSAQTPKPTLLSCGLSPPTCR